MASGYHSRCCLCIFPRLSSSMFFCTEKYLKESSQSQKQVKSITVNKRLTHLHFFISFPYALFSPIFLSNTLVSSPDWSKWSINGCSHLFKCSAKRMQSTQGSRRSLGWQLSQIILSRVVNILCFFQPLKTAAFDFTQEKSWSFSLWITTILPQRAVRTYWNMEFYSRIYLCTLAVTGTLEKNCWD